MASGTIVKLFPKTGLICSSDGKKTYFFFQNSADFDCVVGLKVNFVPEIKDSGYDHATEINSDGELDRENLEYLKNKQMKQLIQMEFVQ